MNEESHADVDVTLLVCTFNRSADLRELVEWLAWKLRRREREAFACEARLCFFAGFFQERRQSLRSSS
jgi:hypothetical protein